MDTLNYEIKTLTPVLISSAGDANLTLTRDYIPGNTLLGIFAAKYISINLKNKLPAHQDNEFYQWFLRGDVIFSNAYLILKGKQADIQLSPTPLPVQKNKKAEIYDLLRENVKNTKPLGEYSHFEDDKIITGTPEKRINFHHYREERLKGHSTGGGIFNYEVLAEGQLFGGVICGTKENLQKIKSLFSGKQRIQVGRSKNSQYGQAEIALSEIKTPKPAVTVAEANKEIVLSFTAPVILLNEYGFPEVSLQILKEYLKRFLGDVDFTVQKCFARVEQIENYVGVWQLKKPLDKAFSGGSVFKIEFTSDLDEKLKSKLESLVIDGLGERTNEGFGRVHVNIETLISGNKYTRKKIEAPKVDKPLDSPPELIKKIFTAVVRENISEFVIREAVRKSENFAKGDSLSTNLLGRLELILKEAKDAQDFVEKIQQLRKTAQDKLKASRDIDNSKTLWELLNNQNQPDWEHLKNNLNDDVKKAAKIAEFDFENDPDFRKKMYKKYWLAFFRNIRRINKQARRLGNE